jgi:hypothetical protein
MTAASVEPRESSKADLRVIPPDQLPSELSRQMIENIAGFYDKLARWYGGEVGAERYDIRNS